jgi:hypothetical protein
MATVVGQSGAWRSVAANLRLCGLEVHQLEDVKPLLTRFRAEYQPNVDRKKSEIAQSVADRDSQIAGLRAEQGVWRSLFNWFRIRRCEIAIERLHSEERRYVDMMSANLQRIESLLVSPEMAGARAELDVIARLAQLPASYTVLNDVRLTANRHIRFNGAALQSAQIDHLVLSPAGVFVIETKRWSTQFTEFGRYHDPFDQTQRAAYLCYDQLRRRFGNIRVRSIIACAGKLPSAPQDSRIKVLPVPELAGYISWFRQQDLTPDQLLTVRDYLQRFVAT